MFSVILPVYNHERYVIQAVTSALSMPLAGEVLIMDDGSRDRSAAAIADIARAMPHRVRDFTIQPARNHGAHACLNHLIAHATYDWIAILNSDDLLFPGRFDVIVSHLRYSQADFLFGHLSIIDANGCPAGVKRGALDPEYSFPHSFDVPQFIRRGQWVDLLSHQNFIATTSNIVFKKGLFHRIGGFGSYRYVHDWDFALRACLLGRPALIPHYLASYRLHGSNTIAEDRGAVESEVQRMFTRLQCDFPEVRCREHFQVGCSENPYLLPFSRRAAGYVCPPGADALVEQMQLEIALGPATVAACRNEVPGYCETIYVPPSASDSLSANDLANVRLAFAHQSLDFVLVSRSLELPPAAGVSDFAGALVARADVYDALVSHTKPACAVRGRVARLFPQDAPRRDLRQMFPDGTVFAGKDILIGKAPELKLRTPRENVLTPRTHKPVIFVLPAFLAVGGVERLAIEVMRQLGHKYEFVVINWEPLMAAQGSLHAAAEPYMSACFDLAELSESEAFLPMMATLRSAYRPALVWICNGSPWLCDHAAELRKLFDGIPIVDQQVYDTDRGWITRYSEPGIQSFDRFIAVNQKIREVMIGRLGMPPDKIDLIYHAIDIDALTPNAARAHRDLALKYGFTGGGPVIAFIGRLAPQKNPGLFLEVALRAQNAGLPVGFLMIGDGPLAGACDKFISAQQLRNVTRVKYCAHLNEIYPLIDAIAITSDYEGLPLAMLEAMAMGVPAIATDVGDIRLVVEQYGVGVIAREVGSVDAFYGALQEFLTGIHTLKTRARGAATRVRERFCGASVAAEYDACFEQAVRAYASPQEMACVR